MKKLHPLIYLICLLTLGNEFFIKIDLNLDNIRKIIVITFFFSNRNPSALLLMEWNKKYELDPCMDFYSNSDSLFLLLFER